MASTQPSLIELLQTTPYLLAYTIPLLLFSLIFTFGGTFLTLDRTRSFPVHGTGAAVYTSLPMPGSLEGLKNKKKKRLGWVFEGGVGGLIGGYLFGVHLSTALALLIPATTASPTLSYNSFLAIWVLSAIVATPLASRYRYVAYLFIGVSGGTFTSLALCVIIHPSHPSRVIVASTFVVLFTILTLALSIIPRLFTSFFHTFLRVCTASTGAFGLVVSIALLLNPAEASWANVWERLWVKDGYTWGTGREQGLSAAFWIFFAAGIAIDWALRRWIGECPDEKWDEYLAHYAANLPNQANRAGTFQPFGSFWDKLFPSSSAATRFDFLSSNKGGSKDLLFPDDTAYKTHLNLPLAMSDISSGKLSKKDNLKDIKDHSCSLSTETDVFKKKPRNKHKLGLGKKSNNSILARGRKPVKFGAEFSSDSDTEEDEEEATRKDDRLDTGNASTPTTTFPVKTPSFADLSARPPARTVSSSTATLVDRGGKGGGGRHDDVLATLDYEKEIEAVKDKLRRNGADGIGSKEEVEYSDYEEEEEEDVTKGRQVRAGGEDDPGEPWSPGFFKRHQSQAQSQGGGHAIVPPRADILAGVMPVPATPSLIKAIDRIALAQRDAYGVVAANSPTSKDQPARPNLERSQPTREAWGGTGDVNVMTERTPRWEEFWREVRTKARTT